LETRILEAVPRSPPATTLNAHSGGSALVSLRIGNQLYVAPRHRPSFTIWLQILARRKNIYPTNRLAAVRLAGELDSFVKTRLAPAHLRLLQDGLDEKSREKLSALGYMASGKTSPSTRIDPKDRIDVANDMHDASLAIEEGKEATVIPAAAARRGPKTRKFRQPSITSASPTRGQGNFAKAISSLAQSHRAAAGCTDGAIRVGHLPVRDRRSEWRCLVF